MCLSSLIMGIESALLGGMGEWLADDRKRKKEGIFCIRAWHDIPYHTDTSISTRVTALYFRVGKSTFLKIIMSLDHPIHSGSIKVGQTIRFGYCDQVRLWQVSNIHMRCYFLCSLAPLWYHMHLFMAFMYREV